MKKTILVTGASTGIGAATARLLAAGNLIFVHYHSSAAEAGRTAGAVAELGGEAVLLQADLSTEQGCRDLMSRGVRPLRPPGRPGEQCGRADPRAYRRGSWNGS